MNDELPRTEWFDGATTKPNLTGDYERLRSDGVVVRCGWDGDRWESANQARPWRGLRSYRDFIKAAERLLP